MQPIQLTSLCYALQGKPLLSDLTVTLCARRIGLIGRNGSGKTTLMRLIAGLIAPSSGTVRLGDLDPYSDRKVALARIGILFQNPDHQILFPTVEEELAFGLLQQGQSQSAAFGRANDMLTAEGRTDWAKAPISTLSHGQKQWLCLQAVLLMGPETLLLDEPFAALDEITRFRLDIRLRELWLERGMTVIFVTHSITEAAFLADRAVVLTRKGGGIKMDRRLALPEIRRNELRASPEFGREMEALLAAMEEES